MPWAAIASAVAPTIIGGLMGSEGSSQTQKNEIDPRMAKYIYGEDGKGGLLSEASKWYENNKTGLNPQMLQGLNTQWAVLNDPANMGAYTQMRNLGSGLMSAPVMGNPFSDGRASLSGGLGMPQMRSMQGGQGGSGGLLGAMNQMQGMKDPRGAMAGMNMSSYMPQEGSAPAGSLEAAFGGLGNMGDPRARMAGMSMAGMAPQSGQTGGFDPRASQQYPSFLNPGMGQPYTPQSPFVQPEWVTKPAAAAPAPAVSPVDAEKQRQQEEAAAMARRY